jgi:hypothetical protein
MTYGPYRSRNSRPDRCGRDRILEATQDGLLDPQMVVEMMARWMTSDEIYEMCDANEINLARMVGD